MDFPFAWNWMTPRWERTAEGYRLELPLPGWRKKDLELTLRDGKLHIRGRKLKGEGSWWSSSRQWALEEFEESVLLPAHADEKKIKARMRDGVLSIHIGTLEKVRTIPVGGGRPEPLQSVVQRGRSWWERLRNRLGWGRRQPQLAAQ